MNCESRSIWNKNVNRTNIPVNMNHVELVYGEEELEIEAAAEMALTLKYGSNISKEDFLKRKQDKLLNEPDVTHIFKVTKCYKRSVRTYLGVIQTTSNYNKYHAVVWFPLRFNPGLPSYGGHTLEDVLKRVERNELKKDIGFKITDLVKI